MVGATRDSAVKSGHRMAQICFCVNGRLPSGIASYALASGIIIERPIEP